MASGQGKYMTCSVKSRVRTVIKDDDAAGTGSLLDEVDALRIVLTLDVLVVIKCSMFGWMAEKLEASGIEGRGAQVAAEILHLYVMLGGLPVLASLAGDGIGVDVDPRLRAVGGKSEVVKLGGNSGGGHGEYWVEVQG
jgi:hypothetical protein